MSGPSTKATIWTKPRSEEPPKDKQKPPGLREKVTHLLPIFGCVQSSLRLKPPLTCSEMIRKDGHVADVYTQINP